MGRPHVAVRIGIVFGAATAIWLFLHWARDAVFGASDYDRGAHVFSAVTATVLAVPLVVLAWRYLNRVPWTRLRRASPRTVGRLLTAGSVGYLIPAAAALTIFLIAGWLTIDLDGSIGDLVLSVLTLVVLVFLYEALPEEFIFRGYIFRNLAAVLPTWAVVFVQALLFALFGVLVGAAGSVERIVIFFGFAVVQGWLRAVTDTLWVPIGFHLAFQSCEQIAGPNWNRFVVDDLALLQDLVLGLIPLALGVLVVQSLGRWARRPAVRNEVSLT
ncbi:type II CAAX endopeptidase family protein [Actinoplanes sp. Pm04-4]|uniref:Type II CAAX endopeptidase family protein n=1 Tax=Paractinoplanes pyxinae TaxID=2997416 RepID=A0ABT4AYW1_9ACTN|nr:type II CAAX endopeptidase family protein [Actinoplanes pyxinae]MCY1139431.1 type II CAAX endopeptidase family protein [Actinoplanes pyxinae]